MEKIRHTQVVYAMSRDNAPVCRIPSGSDVCIETLDCFSNQITSGETPFDGVDWEHVNAATGPIYVEDAMPGDILRIDIKSITITSNHAVMVTGPHMGVLGDDMKEPRVHLIPLENNEALLPGGVRWLLRPMIGVIGVAPEGDPIPCNTPDVHGGNMDCKILGAGSTLWLRVNVEGALFALGDLHAAMGDGEVSVCGLEVPGEVILTLSVAKDEDLPTPMLTNDEAIYTLASALTYDDAAHQATHNMAHFIAQRSTLSLPDITNILSIAGDVQVCQLVDPQKTARVALPRLAADQLNIHLGKK